MHGPSNRDLLAACLLATAAAATVAVTDSAVLRATLGLPMAVLVPGHAMLRAVGIGTRSLAEHLAYAVGASLFVGIAGGLALNVAGLLSPFGWAAWFWIVTFGCSLLAVRRGGGPELPSWSMPAGILPWHATVVCMAVLVATGGYVLAVWDEATQQQFKYTELWALPSKDGGRLTVGVRSAEAGPQRFDLEITLDGKSFAVFRSIGLSPGELWTRELPVAAASGPQKAAARLYRPEDSRLYRSVSALLSRN
jgi:hypothetical protein